ncbi:MAG: sporulation protein YqfD [Clostridia bacterium]|nr:sporulation protein YqfD [Clostridia bacterium]
MLLFKILHFLRGYVRLKAQGGFPERFLNLCSNKKIPLWNVESRGGILLANTTPNGYRQIRTPAKKSGMKVRILKKYGLPFFAFSNRKRIGLLFGIVCFFLIIGILSGMVWTVSVEGCETVSEEEITDALASLGVRPGVIRQKIDIEKTEREALGKLPNISWMSVNFQGSAVIVEVRETTGKLPETQDDTPSNLVAAADGQIVTMEVFSGTREQQVSAAVLKGDLLVGGITENKDGTVNFRKAQGYITAITSHNVTTTLNEVSQLRMISDIDSRCTLVFFGLKIPLGPFNSNKESYNEESYVTLNGIKMPVGIVLDRSYKTAQASAVTDANTIRLLALEEHFSECSQKFEYMKIMESQTTLRQSKSGVTVTGDYKCLQNIGESKEIEIDAQSAQQ